MELKVKDFSLCECVKVVGKDHGARFTFFGSKEKALDLYAYKDVDVCYEYVDCHSRHVTYVEIK